MPNPPASLRPGGPEVTMCRNLCASASLLKIFTVAGSFLDIHEYSKSETTISKLPGCLHQPAVHAKDEISKCLLSSWERLTKLSKKAIDFQAPHSGRSVRGWLEKPELDPLDF